MIEVLFSPGASAASPSPAFSNALVLRGPPGSGKTSLFAKEFFESHKGWDVIALHSSDLRVENNELRIGTGERERILSRSAIPNNLLLVVDDIQKLYAQAEIPATECDVSEAASSLKRVALEGHTGKAGKDACRFDLLHGLISRTTDGAAFGKQVKVVATSVYRGGTSSSPIAMETLEKLPLEYLFMTVEEATSLAERRLAVFSLAKPPACAIEALRECMPPILTLAETPYGIHVGPFRHMLDTLLQDLVKEKDRSRDAFKELVMEKIGGVSVSAMGRFFDLHLEPGAMAAVHMDAWSELLGNIAASADQGAPLRQAVLTRSLKEAVRAGVVLERVVGGTLRYSLLTPLAQRVLCDRIFGRPSGAPESLAGLLVRCVQLMRATTLRGIWKASDAGWKETGLQHLLFGCLLRSLPACVNVVPERTTPGEFV